MSDHFTRRGFLAGAAGLAALTPRSGGCQDKQKDRLSYSSGGAGLKTLTYNGLSLLAAPESGALRLAADPVFRRADGSIETRPLSDPRKTEIDEARQTVTLTYDWGRIVCAYTLRPTPCTLHLHLSLHNATRDTLAKLVLQVLEPEFPAVPQGKTLDAGMFGMGGGLHPLPESPLTASPRAMPPIIFVDYGRGALAFCSDDPASPTAVSIPYAANPPAKTRYPFHVLINEVPPGKTAQAVVSLRFGPAGADIRALAGDVLKRYAAVYPFQLHWSDRRPIGTLFLSSAGKHPAANPRGWFNNAAAVDVNTPQGLMAFRRRLLQYAEDSIKILKEMNAQGMITWDPEGQEFDRATYYGDPRLTEQLAPETASHDANGPACMDAFFQKFRDAGLRVGVCVRPQEIRFINGVPQQTDSPDAAATLKSKIAYARKRWGCTLFYVDSTVKGDNTALEADVFREVAASFPDVLLMPENETLRYFAYSAPLNRKTRPCAISPIAPRSTRSSITKSPRRRQERGRSIRARSACCWQARAMCRNIALNSSRRCGAATSCSFMAGGRTPTTPSSKASTTRPTNPPSPCHCNRFWISYTEINQFLRRHAFADTCLSKSIHVYL